MNTETNDTQRLQQEINLLNTILNHCEEWHLLLDTNGNLLYVSPYFEKISGQSADELKKNPKAVFEQIHAGNHQDYLSAWDHIQKGNDIVREISIGNTPGKIRWFRHSIKQIPDTSTGTRLILVSGKDITELKLASESLVKSEEKYRSLSEITTDAGSSIIINPDGSLTREWTIDKILPEYGMTWDDIDTLDKWISVVHPDDKHIFMEGKNKVMRGEGFTGEVRIITRKGETRWIRDSIKIFIDPQTKTPRIISSVKDITNLKKLEQNLLDSESKYRSLAENMDDIICRLDLHLTIQYINKAIEQYHTLKAENYIGMNIPDLPLSGNTITFVKTNADIIIRTKKAVNTTIKHTSGSKDIFLNCRFYPEFDNNHNVKSILAVCSDITELIKIEQELIRSKNKAEESDKLKSIFLANMSHEIRTPMNAIIGFTTLMSNDVLPNDTRKKYLEIINTSATHLLSIINDILDISKIEAGQMEYFETSIDIHKLLVDVKEQFHIQKEQKKKGNLEIRLNNACDKPFSIITDEVKIQQVLNNLLFNALKFTDIGFIEFGYTINSDQEGNRICFYVKDTGIGIADNKKNIIFERFRQEEENITAKQGGTGLGLAICKGISEVLNGKIWFESKKGEGTTFYFEIPLRPADESNKTNIKAKPFSDFIFLNKNILIIDDTLEIHHYLSEVLVKTGAHLIHAMNARDALKIIESPSNIDIILLDIRLPDLNGIELTRLIKQQFNIPIVAQTALAFSGDRIKVLEAGCDDYLTKPIDRMQLLMSLSKFLVDKKPVW